MARPPANELSGSVESSLVGASLSLDFPIPQEIPRSPASFRDATPHGLHPEELWRALVLVYDLNREPDQDRLLNKILDAAIEMMGAQRGFIFLRERVRDGRDELKIRAARNFDQESLNNPEAQFSRSIVLDVLNSGQTQVLDSAQSHPLFRTKKSVREQKLRAVICSPLRVDESIDGAIYLDNREADRAFAEPEQMLLSILAAQAGVALTRARHVSLLAEKSAKLEELNAELSKQTERKEEIIVEQRSTIAALDRELAVARDRADIFTRFNQIKGSSESLRAVLNIVDRVADSEQTVLIQGETGTGKELVARALHDNSSRRNNRFVAINCPEIAAELLESELFGHIKGSWTGASSDRDGLFVAAQGGTIFLDEITELPLELQSKLLRVLQEREVRPVGANLAVSIDARVIAASNRRIESFVKSGQFREDLFYRLSVIPITLPSLRERPGDIPLLVQHFLEQFSLRNGWPKPKRITEGALRLLEGFEWPGNIRQLRNAVERACLIGGETLTARDFPIATRRGSSSEYAALEVEEACSLDDLEEAAVEAALADAKGNVRTAAKRLGLHPATLYRRLKRSKINWKQFKFKE